MQERRQSDVKPVDLLTKEIAAKLPNGCATPLYVANTYSDGSRPDIISLEGDIQVLVLVEVLEDPSIFTQATFRGLAGVDSDHHRLSHVVFVLLIHDRVRVAYYPIDEARALIHKHAYRSEVNSIASEISCTTLIDNAPQVITFRSDNAAAVYDECFSDS